MNATLKNHPNFQADDYSYLSCKGYSDEEILALWNRDQRHGRGPCRWEGKHAKAKLAYYQRQAAARN